MHKFFMPLMLLSLSIVSLRVLAQGPTAPGTPTGSITNQQVDLQWAPSEDDNRVSGYNLYLNNEYHKTVFDTRYVGALDTSQENEFYVTAFDEPLESEQRTYSERSGTIVFDRLGEVGSEPEQPNQVEGNDTTNPSTPSDLVLVSTLNNAVTVSWPAATDNVGVVGYNVYRQGNYINTVFDTRYTDENPLVGTANNYSVVAFDATRNYSPLSAELSIIVPLPTTDTEIPDETPEEIPEIPNPSTPVAPPVAPVDSEVPNALPEVNALETPPIELEAEMQSADRPAELVALNSDCSTCVEHKRVRLVWSGNPSIEVVEGYRVLFVPESNQLTHSVVSDVPVAGLDGNVPSAVFDFEADLNLSAFEGGCFLIKAYRGSEESEASDPVCFSRS